MFNKKIFLLILLVLVSISHFPVTYARGGGAGARGGFGPGGFGGARGDFENDFGRIDRSYYDRPNDFANSDLQRGLATDGGFDRFMNSPYAKNFINHDINSTTSTSSDAGAYHWNAVRNAYYKHDIFNANWWAYHHGGWYYPWMNNYAWYPVGWPMLAGFWGMNAGTYPVDYDYGNNITYQGNTVYYGDEPAATTAEYAQQSMNLAQSAPIIPSSGITSGVKLSELKAPEQKDWKPFGVFSLVQGGQTDSTKLFQLFVNKEGYIHGNYYDTLTNEVKAVSGAVDKKSMRAAWEISGVKDVTYDTGVANLLKPQSPILIHFGKDKTQQWELVRIDQNEPEKKS